MLTAIALDLLVQQAPRTTWRSLSAGVAAVTAGHVRGLAGSTAKTYRVRSGGATALVVIPNMFDGLELPGATVQTSAEDSARPGLFAFFDAESTSWDDPCKTTRPSRERIAVLALGQHGRS